MTEDELVEARKEIVLQGELLRKYREKYQYNPLASAQEKESMYRENFYQQIEGTVHFFCHLWSKMESIQIEIKYVKSHATISIFWLQTDMNQIFQMRYYRTFNKNL